MSSEIPFRIAVGCILLISSGIAVFYRLRASRNSEPVSRQLEGWPMVLSLRLAGLILAGLTLLYLLAPAWLAAGHVPLPELFRWAALLPTVGGIFLMQWTLSSLGDNLTDTVATRSRASLVTFGPYRYVRHPYYVAAALLMAAVTVLAAQWGIGLCSLVVLGLLAARTPREEAQLVSRFGDDYRAYMARTGRFVWRFWQ